jgi:hypothetical protein
MACSCADFVSRGMLSVTRIEAPVPVPLLLSNISLTERPLQIVLHGLQHPCHRGRDFAAGEQPVRMRAGPDTETGT